MSRLVRGKTPDTDRSYCLVKVIRLRGGDYTARSPSMWMRWKMGWWFVRGRVGVDEQCLVIEGRSGGSSGSKRELGGPQCLGRHWQTGPHNYQSDRTARPADDLNIALHNVHRSRRTRQRAHHSPPTQRARVCATPHPFLHTHSPSTFRLMREANFAFPNQNRACVCISSQLYDRRGEHYVPHHLPHEVFEIEPASSGSGRG